MRGGCSSSVSVGLFVDLVVVLIGEVGSHVLAGSTDIQRVRRHTSSDGDITPISPPKISSR